VPILPVESSFLKNSAISAGPKKELTLTAGNPFSFGVTGIMFSSPI
jgi:hypothetical protein